MSNSQLPIPNVSLINDRPATSSLAIAECFAKEHKNVLADIRTLVGQCPNEFTALNFQPSEYTDPTGRKLPMYNVHFDGFILLVMGYTGPKALRMKLAYIEAFNAMKAKLEAAKKKELPQADATITPPMQAIIQALVKAKVERLPNDKSRKGYYPQVYGRFNNHFGIPRYTELPQSRMSEAVAYLVNMEIRPKAIEPEAPKAEIKYTADDLTIDPLAYEYKKRLFDQVGELVRKMEGLRETIHLMARAGGRAAILSTEKQVLYENMEDCVNGAVTGMNIAIYNLRSACRIGSRTNFCKW